MILDENILKLYATNGFNVLLSGRPGVGKTEIIKSIFNNAFGENNWAYFSASTMDAWVDFVGVPKAVKRGDQEVIELIRPARFAEDNIQAIFFDEFNRAPAKVRNAVMELIQFKSINGRKFNNLKVIWAAINPYDEEGTYNVEELDPAQQDRFQIQIDVPYKLDRKYLNGKYGAISGPFADWWTSHVDDVKHRISPRRLEDGIRVHLVKGDLSHVFPKDSNIANLRDRISKVSLDDEWKDVIKMSKVEREVFLQNVSNVEKFKDLIIKSFDQYAEYVPHDYLISRFDTKQTDWIDAALSNVSAIPKAVVKEVEKSHGDTFEDSLKKLKGIFKQSGTLNLQGKRVVVTGTFKKRYSGQALNRNDVEALLGRIGASVQNKISSSTDYLICANPSSNTTKTQEAQRYNVKILSEDDFHAAYGNI